MRNQMFRSKMKESGVQKGKNTKTNSGKNSKNIVFCLGVKIWDSRPFQQSKYIVFHEESESEVKNSQLLEPEGKNQTKRNRKMSGKNIYAQNLILVNLILVNFGGFLIIARNPTSEF